MFAIIRNGSPVPYIMLPFKADSKNLPASAACKEGCDKAWAERLRSEAVAVQHAQEHLPGIERPGLWPTADEARCRWESFPMPGVVVRHVAHHHGATIWDFVLALLLCFQKNLVESDIHGTTPARDI